MSFEFSTDPRTELSYLKHRLQQAHNLFRDAKEELRQYVLDGGQPDIGDGLLKTEVCRLWLRDINKLKKDIFKHGLRTGTKV